MIDDDPPEYEPDPDIIREALGHVPPPDDTIADLLRDIRDEVRSVRQQAAASGPGLSTKIYDPFWRVP